MAVTVVRHKTDSERLDSDFAAVYRTAQGTKVRKLPIYDAAHARNALARFNQTDMPSNIRNQVKKRILAAAKKFKIEVTAKRYED